MLISRAGGWMEASGAVKGRAGVRVGGRGWGLGREEGRGEEGSDHRPCLDCGTMMTELCVACLKQARFVKYITAELVVVVVAVMVVVMADGWWWCWCGVRVRKGGWLNTIEFNMAVQWWQHCVCSVCAGQTCFVKNITADSMQVSSRMFVAK